MPFKPLLALTLTLASMQTVHARSVLQLPEASCSDLDIRDINPHARELLSTPRHQGNVGWCYGFTAADMISAETGTYISAAHVSSIFNKRVAGDFFMRTQFKIMDLLSSESDDLGAVYEGGYIANALKGVWKMGSVCAEKDMGYDKNYLGEYRNILISLNAIKDAIKKNTATLDNVRLALQRTLPLNTFGSVDFDSVIEDMRRFNINKVIEKLMRSKCEGNLVQVDRFRILEKNRPGVNQTPKDEKEAAKAIAKVQDFFGFLNTALEKGKPVGLSYNVQEVVGQKGWHASSIVARRYKNGSCEYKVRNSWGNNCFHYLPGVDCVSSEGAFWVGTEKLYKMAREFTYIE